MAHGRFSPGHCLDLFHSAAAHHAGGRRHHDDPVRGHEIYQSSTITALLDGVYDGGLTYAELERHGDFGLGTFNGLDGEMVALDGAFFHLHVDGTATPVDPAELTPFAAVCFFQPQLRLDLPGPMSEVAVEQTLDQRVASLNLFYAVRLDGRFSSVTTRTVGRQRPPYRPLIEATAEQAVTEFTDISGSVIGFRAPDYASGMTVAGYHLHFIADDRSCGGHVLGFTLAQGALSVDTESGLHVELPESAQFLGADLSGHDVAAETATAEGMPGSPARQALGRSEPSGSRGAAPG